MPPELFSVQVIEEAARGCAYELKSTGELHINFLTIRKGFARGGSSHSFREGFFLLSGKVEFHTGTLENDKVSVFEAGSIINTDPGEAHYMVALQDSVFVEIRPHDANFTSETKYYEPFRSVVLSRKP